MTDFPALPDGFVLRPYSESDVDGLHEALVRESATSAGLPPWLTKPTKFDAQGLVAAGVQGSMTSLCEYRALVHDGRHLGAVVLADIELVSNSARFGYWVAASVPGAVLWTAAAQVLDHAFGDLRLHRLEVRALADDSHAQVTYPKLGFMREATLREAAIVPGEGAKDVAVYCQLRRVWDSSARPRLEAAGVITPVTVS